MNDELRNEWQDVLSAVNEVFVYRAFPKQTTMSDGDVIASLTEIIGWATELRDSIVSVADDEGE